MIAGLFYLQGDTVIGLWKRKIKRHDYIATLLNWREGGWT